MGGPFEAIFVGAGPKLEVINFGRTIPIGAAWLRTAHGRLMLTVLGGLAELQRTSVRRSSRGSRKARRRRTLRDPTPFRSPRFLGLLLPLSWKARPASKAGQVAAAVKTVAKKRPHRSGAKFGVCGREGFPPQQRNSGTRDAVSVTTIRISLVTFGQQTNTPAGAGSVSRISGDDDAPGGDESSQARDHRSFERTRLPASGRTRASARRLPQCFSRV
jgi:hypothetical protein